MPSSDQNSSGEHLHAPGTLAHLGVQPDSPGMAGVDGNNCSSGGRSTLVTRATTRGHGKAR